MATAEPGAAPAPLEVLARRALADEFGPGASATALAPGRCTIVGEHVDYAGGLVLATAINLMVAVAVRRAAGADQVAGGGVRSTSVEGPPRPEGGGYVLAAAAALRAAGVDVPAFHAATAADLPAAAGLASSAAVVCATLAALLRLRRTQLPASAFIDIAHRAEHDVLGVMCGRLDQHAVVESTEAGPILLDAAADRVAAVPWHLRDVVLVVCDTGERHSVAGPEYSRRRAETAAAMRAAGLRSAQEGVALAVAEASLGHDPLLMRRLRHVVTESRRAAAAAVAVEAGDAARLGELMSQSHRSLRDDHEVTTPVIDAAVAAAEAVPGCYGARMVGGGFGGSVLALSTVDAAPRCEAAMRQACPGAGGAWSLLPRAGLAATAADAITPG